MTQYVLKRILLMVPTFFLVSLLIFLVLNFAPGKPGDVAQEGGTEDADTSGSKRESYRIFKEQFGLDKPVLFNTRFMLAAEDIRLLAMQMNNISGDVPVGARIEAEEEMEDLGNYAVPGLIALLQDDNPELVRFAANRLRFNGKRRLVNEFGQRPSEDEIALNREIGLENQRISEWGVASDASPEQVTEARQHWEGWFQEHADRWDWSGGDKARILLLDTRFARYWSNLVRLDFGVSHVDKQPVLERVFSKLKYSISLSLTSLILAYTLAVPLGVISAVRHNSRLDRSIGVALFILYSLPSFFSATLFLRFLTIGEPLALFPVGGFQDLDNAGMTVLDQLVDIAHHMVLPVICLTYGGLAALSRYSRSGVLDVIRSDYIRTARAKGLPEMVVIIKHAVRNGMIPILTLLASLLPVLLGGSVIIEVIFAIPGMGTYMFESILARDYNVIMAVLLMASVLTMSGLLLSDISYALVDPRISFD